MLLRALHDVEFQHVEEFCRTWSEGVRVEYEKEGTQKDHGN
jgi:hypothetical protein